MLQKYKPVYITGIYFAKQSISINCVSSLKLHTMNVKNILLPAIAGTSLMTISSYIASHLEQKNFREPELLARIEKKLLQLPKDVALPAGWITHYSVGAALTLLYTYLKQNADVRPKFKTGLAFGASSGILSILVWKLALKILPARSKSFYNKYYTQLFLVHFVFAFIVLITQKAMHNTLKR